MAFDESKLIRRSALVIIRNLVLFELLSVALFFGAASVAHYEHLYTSIPFTVFLPYEIAEYVFFSFAQVFIVSLIFISWYRETYEFIPGAIVHQRGIVFSTKTVFTFSPSYTVSCVHDPVSRMFNLGTLSIKDSVSADPLKITFLSNPERYVEYLSGTRSNKNGVNSMPRLTELLGGAREHEHLEFKETFRWDTRENRISKDLEHAVIKTVAAFLNCDGGHLVVGVDDSGKVIGLDRDYKTLKKQNADGFEIHFTHIFNNKIGAEFRNLVGVHFETFNGNEVCVVAVAPSLKPVYVSNDKGEEFYIRTGNATTNLSFRHAASYIETHWKR